MFFKKKLLTKAKPANKTAYCLKCLKPYSVLPKNKQCSCKGIVHLFDSMMESQRFLNLKHDPNISHLKVQVHFPKALPVAIYDNGYLTGREPVFKRYSNEICERSGYNLDFTYYDNTTTKGWIAEEFKPCLEKMDTQTKIKLNDAYDQHQNWGHFCYAYPENNFENNKIKQYKRLFVTRAKKTVRYIHFDDFFY